MMVILLYILVGLIFTGTLVMEIIVAKRKFKLNIITEREERNGTKKAER